MLYGVFQLNVPERVVFRLSSCVLCQVRFLRAVGETGWRSGVELDASERWTFPGAFLYSVSLVTTVGETALQFHHETIAK